MLFAIPMSNPQYPSPRGSTPVVLALSALLGSLSWWLLASLSGEREAWDSALYFVGVVPALTLACALAARGRLRGALWIAPAFACGEWLALLVLSGGDLGLWPVGLLFTAITHAPAFGFALAITVRQGHRESRA